MGFMLNTKFILTGLNLLKYLFFEFLCGRGYATVLLATEQTNKQKHTKNKEKIITWIKA